MLDIPAVLARKSNVRKLASIDMLKKVRDPGVFYDIIKKSIERDYFISLKDIRTVIYSSLPYLIKIY